MTKAELIQYLQSYISAKERYDSDVRNEENLRRQVNELRKKPQQLPKLGVAGIVGFALGRLIATAFVAAVVALIIFVIFAFAATIIDSIAVFRGFFAKLGVVLEPIIQKLLVPLLKPIIRDITNAYGLLFILWLIIFYLPCFVVTGIREIVRQIRDSKDRKIRYANAMHKYEKGIAALPALESKLKDASQTAERSRWRLNAVIQKGVIHKSYLEYASTLLDYLQKGRADTLKEALNLLEMERSQIRSEIAMDEHNAEVQRKLDEMAARQSSALADIQDEAERATNAAATAAGLSAASAWFSWEASRK